MKIGALVLGLFLPVAAIAAEEHGKTDVFATRGVALAWAVQRGKTEDSTFLVIRVVTEPALFQALSVTGRDPFTKAEHAWLPMTATPGRLDVRIPRGKFGDFPRTELRFFGRESADPRLMVFYQGAPDTTPEFDDPKKLDTYLDERLARVAR